EASLAGVLGGVHRHVGVAEEIVRTILRRGLAGNPDAAGDDDLAALQVEWSPQPLADPLRHANRLVGAGAFEQHGELVAAEPGHRVAWTDTHLEPVGDDDQEAIAALVAETVVDDLELIDVEIEHRQIGGLAVGTGEGVTEAVHEEGAVGKTG